MGKPNRLLWWIFHHQRPTVLSVRITTLPLGPRRGSSFSEAGSVVPNWQLRCLVRLMCHVLLRQSGLRPKIWDDAQWRMEISIFFRCWWIFGVAKVSPWNLSGSDFPVVFTHPQRGRKRLHPGSHDVRRLVAGCEDSPMAPGSHWQPEKTIAQVRVPSGCGNGTWKKRPGEEENLNK